MRRVRERTVFFSGFLATVGDVTQKVASCGSIISDTMWIFTILYSRVIYSKPGMAVHSSNVRNGGLTVIYFLNPCHMFSATGQAAKAMLHLEIVQIVNGFLFESWFCLNIYIYISLYIFKNPYFSIFNLEFLIFNLVFHINNKQEWYFSSIIPYSSAVDLIFGVLQSRCWDVDK